MSSSWPWRMASTSLRSSSSSDWRAISSKLARNSAAMARTLAMNWPSLRSSTGRSFGPTTISATTAAIRNSTMRVLRETWPCLSAVSGAVETGTRTVGRCGSGLGLGARLRGGLAGLGGRRASRRRLRQPAWRGGRRGSSPWASSSPFRPSRKARMPLAVSPMMPEILPRPPNSSSDDQATKTRCARSKERPWRRKLQTRRAPATSSERLYSRSRARRATRQSCAGARGETRPAVRSRIPDRAVRHSGRRRLGPVGLPVREICKSVGVCGRSDRDRPGAGSRRTPSS